MAKKILLVVIVPVFLLAFFIIGVSFVSAAENTPCWRHSTIEPEGWDMWGSKPEAGNIDIKVTLKNNIGDILDDGDYNIRITQESEGDWMSSTSTAFSGGEAVVSPEQTTAGSYEFIAVEVEHNESWIEIGTFHTDVVSGSAHSMTVDPKPSSVGQGEVVIFVVEIVDEYGNPVSGETVTFDLAGGEEEGTGFGPPSPETNSEGKTGAVLTINDSEGISDNKLTVTVGHGVLDNETIENIDVVVTDIHSGNSSISPEGSLGEKDAGESVSLEVTIKNSTNDPIEVPRDVRISHREAGDVITLPGVNFDSDGKVNIAFNIETAGGYENIIVEVKSDVENWVSVGKFDLTIIPSNPHEMEIIYPDGLEEVGQGEKHYFGVTVKDEYGNLIRDEDVTFQVSGGSVANTEFAFGGVSGTGGQFGEARAELHIGPNETTGENLLTVTINHSSIENIVISNIDVIETYSVTFEFGEGVDAYVGVHSAKEAPQYSGTGPLGPEITEGYTEEDGKVTLHGLRPARTDHIRDGWYWYFPSAKGGYVLGDFDVWFFEVENESVVVEPPISAGDPVVVRALTWDGETEIDNYPHIPTPYFYYHGAEGNRDLIRFTVEGGEIDFESSLTADFSMLGGGSSISPIEWVTNEDRGYWVFEWDWSSVDDNDIPSLGNQPFYEISVQSGANRVGMMYVLDFNPVVMIPELGGDTTDWEQLPEETNFTAVENLIFHREDVGKIKIYGPVDLTDRVTAQNLAMLPFYMSINEGEMSLNTDALIAFAGNHGKATITMYNIDFEEDPSIRHINRDGDEELVVISGVIQNIELIESFEWNDSVKTIEMTVSGWSTYKAIESVSFTFEEGSNLEGVSVEIYSDSSRTKKVGSTLVTDGSGEVSGLLVEGSYWFTASRSGYKNLEGTFNIGEVHKIVQFEMIRDIFIPSGRGRAFRITSPMDILDTDEDSFKEGEEKEEEEEYIDEKIVLTPFRSIFIGITGIIEKVNLRLSDGTYSLEYAVSVLRRTSESIQVLISLYR